MSEDKFAKVKAGVSDKSAEFELELGSQVPRALASLFPTSALRSQTRKAISGSLLRKLAAGHILDDADIEYLENVLKPAEAKWIKQKMILERAAQILAESPPKAALPPYEAASNESSRDDWFAKFWDDAGLISDKKLREIYARILVSESATPGSCSMRTLKVIRYLDPETANLFAKIIPLIVSFRWLPNETKLLEKYGITFNMILELSDAELLHTGSNLTSQADANVSYDYCGQYIVRCDEFETIPLKVFPLTRAGRELSRVAEVKREPEHFQIILQWLDGHCRFTPKSRVFWAICPEGKRPGDLDDATLEKLSWTEASRGLS